MKERLRGLIQDLLSIYHQGWEDGLWSKQCLQTKRKRKAYTHPTSVHPPKGNENKPTVKFTREESHSLNRTCKSMKEFTLLNGWREGRWICDSLWKTIILLSPGAGVGKVCLAWASSLLRRLLQIASAQMRFLVSAQMRFPVHAQTQFSALRKRVPALLCAAPV